MSLLTVTVEPQRIHALDCQVRLDIRRHDFKERERLVLGVILDFSFALGRERAVIQKLDDIVELTGISRGNVHTCLKALESMGVLSIEGSVYRVLPRSAQRVWQVRPIVDLTRAEALSRQLHDLNKVTQGELIPEDPTLTQALGAVSVEAALSASLVPDLGTCRDERRGRVVPDSGTPVPNLGTKVPDSGTPLSLKKKEAQSASSLKRYGAGMDKARLPDISPDELHHVPTFRDNLHFQAWCIGLEAKHGQWMGIGNAETWAESFGGLWWRRWLRAPDRFRAVWNETLSRQREGGVGESIGGYANDLWCYQRVG